MTWAIFAILAAVTWAVNNIFDKFILTKWVKNTSIVAFALGINGLLTGIIVYILHGLIPMPVWAVWLSLLGGALYLFANWIYFQAAQKEEISKVIPLVYLDPLFTALLAIIFLQEVLNPIKYLGIFVLVAGAVLISTDKLKISKSYGVMLAIISSVLYSVCNILNKVSYNSSDFWTAFAYIRIGGFFGSLFFAGLYFKELKNEFKSIGPKSAFIFLNEFLVLVGATFFALAISKGPVSQTNALTAVQPFFVFIFATLVTWLFPKIIKERISRMSLVTKLSAITLIFAGTVLLTLY